MIHIITVISFITIWILLMSVRTGINPDGGLWFNFSWLQGILKSTNKKPKEVCEFSLDILCPSNHGERWIECERLKKDNIICPYLREKNKNIRRLNSKMDKS